jgi:hypothetical protein
VISSGSDYNDPAGESGCRPPARIGVYTNRDVLADGLQLYPDIFGRW